IGVLMSTERWLNAGDGDEQVQAANVGGDLLGEGRHSAQMRHVVLVRHSALPPGRGVCLRAVFFQQAGTASQRGGAVSPPHQFLQQRGADPRGSADEYCFGLWMSRALLPERV